ncbi:hypothetical protein Aduo_008440 [Ancylostoma duodenale]
MEEVFDCPPSCFATGGSNSIAVGFMDGIVQMANYDLTKKSFQTQWKFKTKAGVRGMQYSRDQSEIFAITSNKGISCFDVETGKRKRCIMRGHDDKPTAICLLQPTASKHQQFATGDESGEVRTWDFRADNPRICSWKEQEGDVNALRIDNRHNVLSASSDGTIAAYEVRKRKLRMRSEMMHSELVSLCVTDKYVYAGGRDGYLEVFVHGDYGNILERIETGFEMGVDDVVELRKGLLLTCSGCSDKLRLINVMPTKKLGSAGTHGDDDGIDQLMVTSDGSTLVSMSTFANSIKFWPLAGILKKIPVLRVVDIQKRKPVVKEGFFDDIMDKKKKRRAEDSDEENGVEVDGDAEYFDEMDDEDEEEDEDDEEEEDEDEDEDED